MLDRIAKDYKFRSTCEMVLTLLRLYALHVLRSEAARSINPTIHDEIGSMFDEMSMHEPQPSDTPVPKKHRTIKL